MFAYRGSELPKRFIVESQPGFVSGDGPRKTPHRYCAAFMADTPVECSLLSIEAKVVRRPV